MSVPSRTLGGGWLRSAIEFDKGYGFRKDYVSDDELAARRKAKEKRELAHQARETALRDQQDKEDAAKRKATENFMASLASDDEREAFFQTARHSVGNKFANQFYERSIKSKKDEDAKMWRNTILETYLAEQSK